MTRIITDTTSCLPKAYAEQNGIPVIPQVIVFGEESFLEGVELDTQGFMERLVNSPILPKTSAPPPELFIKAFSELTPFNEPILCIHPSSDVSGTVRSATIAAEEFPNVDIRIIDTRLVASPIAILVQLAVQWAASGVGADEIVKRITDLSPTCKIYFLVPTLDFLARGGRIGGAQALLASILQIKPILIFKDGKVDQFEKARTQKHALTRMKELVKQQYPSDKEGYLTVLQAGVPEQGQALANELSAMLNLPPVPVFDMPPAIVTHGGPGILGVTFFHSN